jgi:two-component system chemotaxis sensor kinase CheA
MSETNMEKMEKDEAFLKRLLATFKAEAAEHIAAISTGLVELEKASSAEVQAGIIEAVFREAHSMKGAARAVNLTQVEAVCQSFEGVLAALKRKEIAPEGEIPDLLHRTVNLLGELLAALREEDGLIEKKEIRDLRRDLDDTTRKAHREKRTRTNEENPADYSPLLRGGNQPLSAPAPGTFQATAETVRVAKQKLDSILFQTEELLSIKQAAGQRAGELREIVAIVSGLKKDLAGTRPEIRTVVGKEKKKEAIKTPSDEVMGKHLDFLASSRDQVSRLEDALCVLGRALENDRRSIAGMIDGLLDDVKTISMLPFSSLLEIMPKVVRDLAHDRGKEAVFRTSGAEIEIDRRILDEMREPLIHLVRNCVDHGIENPEERIAKKKTPVGTVRIDVVQREGKSVEVFVSDDGAGINVSEIGRSAVRLGILSKEEADRMDEPRLLRLIFFSGMTTSPIITDISGRGLGLAIVQERVEKLGGAVFCETAVEKGVSFRILLPLTLATFRGLVVHTEDRQVVVPLTGLDRTIRVKQDDIKTVENKETITLGGQTIPLVPLRAVLELTRKEKRGIKAGTVQAVVLGTAEHRIAFTVDAILHEQEVLVKNLGRQLVRVRNITGATVLGTGQVVPVLNVPDLLKSAVKVSVPAEEPLVAEETEKKSILVVEDSITARALLKNILESAGYDVKSAVDGLDAYTMLRAEDFGLVVSDVDMPRMNGFELTTKIRSDKRLAELPVILVTALDSREDRERGIDVGANAYIVKSSFDQSNLLEVIKRLI